MSLKRFNFKFLLPKAGRPHGLRRRLMSFLGVVWLFMLMLIGAGVVSFVYRTEVAAWRGRQGEAARNAAGTVAAFIQRADDALVLLGWLGRDELAAQPPLVHQVLEHNPALQEIVLLDAKGSVVASVAQDRPLLANLFTISQSQWFVTAKAGQPYHGSLQISSRDEPYLIIALPAPEGEVTAARLRMDVLWDAVADIRFGRTGRAYVVTRTGQIIAHTNPEVVLANTSVGEMSEMLPALSAPTGEWYGAYVDLEGTRVVGVAAAVPGTDWLVITELPQREAFAASRTALVLLGASLLVLMSLTMWISARFLERTIFHPMEALREGSERIGRGELRHRIALIGQDEVGQVAVAFNEMADSLYQRDAELAAKTVALIKEVGERKRAEDALRRRSQQQEHLLHNARQLTATLDLQQVLAQIAGSAREILDANDCIIYLLEEGGQTLRPVVAIDPLYEKELLATKLDVDSSFTGQAVKARRALVFNDALTHPIGTQISGTPEEEDECVIVAPFIADDRIPGAMCLHRYRTPFTEEDLVLAETFAIYAATALRNAQTYQALQHEVEERKKAEETLRQQNKFLSALYDTTLALMNRLELENVLEQIVAHAGQLAGTPHGYVYLEGPGPGEIEVRVGLGIFSQRLGYRMQVGEGLAGRVWQSGQPLRVDDYDVWAGRSAGYPYGETHAVIGVPLKVGSQVGGVLGIAYADPDRRFGDDQLEMLGRFAQLASIALDNARLYTAVQQELAERKQAEQALRESEARYRAIVEDQTELICRFLPDGRLTFVNQTYCRYFGKEREELIGYSFMPLIPEEDRHLPEQHIATLSPETPVVTYEHRVILASGDVRWQQWTDRAIYDEQGQVIEFASVGRDVTERRLAESQREAALEALRQLNEELEERVEKRTAELASANQELQMEIAERKRAEDRLRHTANRQTLLYQVLRSVSGQLELDAIARLTVNTIVAFTGWPHICFVVPNEAGTHWVIRAADGELAAEVGLTCPMSQGVIGRVLRTAQTQLVRDVRTDPDYKGENPLLLSELTVPIRQGERILAVLNLESDRPAAFGAEEVQLAESLAEAIALALENARLFEATQVELAERRRIEAALRESEERYRLNFEHVTDIVYSIDREFQVLDVSPSVERHLGYRPQELIGRPFHELKLIAPDSMEAALRDALRVFGGERIASATYEFIAKDGTRKIGEVSGAPLIRDGQVPAIICVGRDITERVRAEEQIKASLGEKEVLLKEIHHRVKNNLQVISSLLNLQSRGLEDPATIEMFRDSQNRIRSMALIHEKLYRSQDLAQIDFAEYIRELTSFLFRSYSASTRGVTLKVHVDDTQLDIDSAVPCGLILNELISNALKHAFPLVAPGADTLARDKPYEIRVEVKAGDSGQLTMSVGDNGIGFPEGLDFRQSTSLGLQLVNTLVNQLNGTLELHRNDGTQFRIMFPIP